MAAVESKPTWSLAPKAARILGGIPPRQVARLAEQGYITALRVPGCETRYLLADVERLAAQFTEAAVAVDARPDRLATISRGRSHATGAEQEEGANFALNLAT